MEASLSDERMLEVVLDTVDEPAVQKIETELAPLNPKRARPTRDLLTVLTIIATVAAIVKTLLEIRSELRKSRSDGKVRIRNADRDELDLIASSEDQIRAFIENSMPPG
jgi:hypothetical protein